MSLAPIFPYERERNVNAAIYLKSKIYNTHPQPLSRTTKKEKKRKENKPPNYGYLSLLERAKSHHSEIWFDVDH